MDRTALAVVAARAGAVLLPDSAGWTNRLKIRSETSSREYVVAQRSGGDRSWGCSCMGWKRYRNCKHLTAIRPMLAAAGGSNGAR